MEGWVVIRRLCSGVWSLLLFSAIFFAITASGQSTAPAAQKDATQEKDKASSATAGSQQADVSGDWQVSWEVRMGTNPGTLHLQQSGAKLTGTFKDLHGLSSVSGTVDENRVTFDVAFQGRYPFTIRFTGKGGSDKIEGSSQAIDVKDEGGAFLGHGGEVVHPEHPWTAVRVTDATRSSNTNTVPASAARK